MNQHSDIFTYTPDMMRPNCFECGRAVSMPDDHLDPTQTWEGECLEGHKARYELDEEGWGDEDEDSSAQDLFPSYRKHTKVSDFLAAFTASAYSMLQDNATGITTVTLANTVTATLGVNVIADMLDNPGTLLETVSKYTMVVFDGGNVYGDSWKSVFYPQQMIHTFVRES